MSWPNDADGDVMRRLQAAGFAFDEATTIDFDIDFQEFPPDAAVLTAIATELPNASVSMLSDYVRVEIHALVSYAFVTAIQARLTEVVASYGGECAAWGVLQRPAS